MSGGRPLQCLLNCNHSIHLLQESECEKAKMDVTFGAQSQVANAERAFQMAQASFQKEVNAAVSIQQYIKPIHCKLDIGKFDYLPNQHLLSLSKQMHVSLTNSKLQRNVSRFVQKKSRFRLLNVASRLTLRLKKSNVKIGN